MPGGKAVWVEYETQIPGKIGEPAKGGQRTKTSKVVSGTEAQLVGKINKNIKKLRGLF